MAIRVGHDSRWAQLARLPVASRRRTEIVGQTLKTSPAKRPSVSRLSLEISHERKVLLIKGDVLLKGMLSEKHFSPPERQEYFFDIQPPALEATFLLQLLDRFAPLRSGPLGRGATGLGCFLVPVVSCSLT